MVSDKKKFTRLLEFIKLYAQNPVEIFPPLFTKIIHWLSDQSPNYSWAQRLLVQIIIWFDIFLEMQKQYYDV